MSANQKAMEFAQSIVRTREFAELQQAKAIIDKNKALKNDVDAFVEQQMNLVSSGASDREMEAKTAELNRKFQSLSKIPEVDRFLRAAKSFNDMMSNAYKVINDTLDSQLNSR